MKPIKLTKKQKEKLIEMCNKLFPAEGFLLWGVPKGNLDLFSQKQQLKIHWYELCCTYLIEELAILKFNGITDDIIFEETKMTYFEAIGLLEKHPIDFLYKEFKKIKK